MESEEEISIDKCRMNSDYSVLTTIHKHKLSFFETKTFKEIADFSDKNTGFVSLAFPIHRSNIIIILGKKANLRFPENTVHLWNIEKQESIGSISIKVDPMMPDDLLFNVFLANTYLFVASRYRIYMFDLMTLEHEFTFEDVYGKEGCISMYYSEKQIILSYISNNNQSIVKVNKIKILKDGLKYSQRFIATNFASVQYIQISPKGKFLAVADGPGEKMNLYSLRSYKVKKCLWRGYGNVKIISIFFDTDNNYLGIYSSQKTLHIYPILEPRFRGRQSITGRKSLRRNTNASINANIINNDEEDEEQMQANKGKNKPSKIVGMFKNFRKKIGTKYVDSFARFKDDKVLVRDIVISYFNENKDIILIDKIGKVFVVKFNKKNGGMCWITETKKLDTNN
jgi:hypothetical protein